MWKEKLNEIIKEKKLYGEKINIGATTEEINAIIDEIHKELNLSIPSGYIKILEVVNGLEFNGFILYGIDECLLRHQPNQNIYGLSEYNQIWHENGWHDDYFFIGEGNISWYVYDLKRRQYIELDNPSGREAAVFSNIEDMVEKILGDALL